MSLNLYPSFPFIAPIGETDTFIGTGSATLFPLEYNTAATLAGVVQFDLVNYIRTLGGFVTPSNSQILLTGAPPNGSQGIAPSSASLPFPVWDQTTVAGVSGNANAIQVPFYLADDGADIAVNAYLPPPGVPGIPIFFQNLVSAAGAQLMWTQLACANVDGSIGTLAATGATIYTDSISATTTLTAAASALNTTIQVYLASGTNGTFYPGDYLIINPGGTTVEYVQVTAISGSTFTITGLNYNHSIGETVQVQARKFWAQVTMPVGTLGGVATSFYNLAVSFSAAVAARF
jgi:hypothetical protein